MTVRHRVLALLALAVGVFGAWRALRPAQEVPLPTTANEAEERMQDFRDALYFPIREFLDGGNPYHPAAMFAQWPVRQDFNLYQPYHLALHLPFALPGYRVGAVAFAVVSLLLLVALAYLTAVRLRPYVPMVVGTAVPAALLVSSQVGKAQLYVGQVNPLVAVGAAGALLVRESHPRWASAALAFAWLKPQFGLPLTILLCCRGSRKVAGYGTLAAAVASLPVLVLLVVNAGGVGPFAETIVANLVHARGTSYGAVDSVTAQRIDLPAVLFRATGFLLPGGELLALVGVLAVSAVLVRRLDRLGDPDAGAVADLLVGLAVVVCVVHQPGDILIAVPALALTAVVWWRRRREPGWGLLGVAVVASIVPFAHLHVFDVALVAVFGERAAVTVDGLAVVCAWLALAVFGLRLHRRAREKAAPHEVAA
ncbi:glycosyltransferase 87 family protein [Amycolatopsis magusensis]|uniref:Na+-transporting methylmalonyl-CoA/oxaloacetate decarboxylase gamma subunit n=1 Tax=Amycolatopsis magusensis TaxID=882444 RepID=A0ABS4PTI1_9PSEU|nr:glycosyltransferase family 87 protein [Amycolatopsis magusensis]MBP2182623.1 Na+-transporting methylmalonyl-CoA/oxaloacetate decarboxylase gamma subunit [Amycolatopsis magusensis]